MASRQDLDLAKLLLTHRILEEDEVRRAFETQASWMHHGRNEPLAEVLYELNLVPGGSLATLAGPSPEVSQPFPGYRVTGLLGEGGMSTVYRGVYLANKTPVAIKVLKPIQALRGDYRRRFEDEARLLLELEHPAIVAGYERGVAGGHVYFTMDLVEGATVQEVIDRRGYLTSQEALSVTWQVAQALAYLHARDLLHRDIKPGNVMVEASGRARLIDLGLVGRIGAGGGAESSSVTVGTVEYLSPEQARGRADLDPRSDIYSLGVSLYHMVVGEVPFQGETDYEVMAKQIMASLDTQKVKNRRIPPQVHFFIAKMTSKERESRYARLEDVVRDVAGYLPGGAVPIDLGTPQVVMPVAPPVARPVARPMSPPVARPISHPVAPPVARPVSPPVAPPLVRPVVPIAAPAARPAVPVAPPVAKPIAPPAAVPIGAPAARPAVPVAAPLAPPVAPPRPPAGASAPAAPAPSAAPVAKPEAPAGPPPPPRKVVQAPIPKHKRKPGGT